ncbi:MAG: hypothetical protein BroJett011_04130 [Chloroflexota bacterium]|nr:MAG: hypothetical protein BroJett011_04130 [Chloroflexota bacterium]
MAVILVHCLAEFVSEAPPPGPARLSLAASRLDLQARTPAGLVWLSDGYTDAAPAEVHAQLPQARAAIERWLRARGYEVRPGRWATPASLRPARGRFECLAWEGAERWQLVVHPELATRGPLALEVVLS